MLKLKYFSIFNLEKKYTTVKNFVDMVFFLNLSVKKTMQFIYNDFLNFVKLYYFYFQTIQSKNVLPWTPCVKFFVKKLFAKQFNRI